MSQILKTGTDEFHIVECGKNYFVIDLKSGCQASIEPINKSIQKWQRAGKRRMPKPRYNIKNLQG